MNYYEQGDGPRAYPGPGAPANSMVGTASGPSTPAAAPQAPGSISFPGSSPDYGGLIQSDPAYGAAKAAADLAQSTAAARRKQALQQQVIQYGGLPQGFQDQYGDVDQATLDQAKSNQFSVLSNLGKRYAETQQQFQRGLAARGALQSGDLNYGEDQLNQAYGQQRYDAANQVGNGVNDALGQYTGVLGNNAQNLAGAIGQAESNVYSNPAYRPTPESSANYDAQNSAAYGQPIYVDSQGNQYDANGNPFNPGGGGTPTPAAPPAPEPYFGATNLDWTGLGPVTA